uniref:Uncharacterized protein n=1 Tax=Araucaria cunninghamii TaxID=56994 RepID=A0A0D6QZE0_ARACU
MSQFEQDDFDYMVADYEMADFDDNVDDELQVRHRRRDVDSETEDEFDGGNKSPDTTAVQARRGKDIQGIPWDRLNYSRERYRENRLQQYKNYENLPRRRNDLDKECKHSERGSNFYDFRHNTRSVKATIVHFQLRNLVWATSKQDVYLLQNYSIMHWSPLTQKASEVLNVAGHVAPSQKHTGSASQCLTRVQISTMSVKHNLVVAGGFQGELICKYLDKPGVAYCTKIAHDENAITNAVEIYESASGSTRLMTANNDSILRVFDAQNFSVLERFSFPWSINHTAVSPDSKLVAVLGDNTDCLLADSLTGKTVATLKGHMDYGFAGAWHPDGHILATGNQDKTCRLWDVRNLSSSFAVLKGRMGAIRSIRFSSDGRFMAMAEPADFVHIYDTWQDYEKSQEIDLFGENAGISFSPDSEAFFVGVADRTYGSLLEYNRRRSNFYLDTMF